MSSVKKNVLGRGLDALITIDDVKASGSSSINEVKLTDIIPNPEQPRKDFDSEGLNELAESIKTIGIVQPITLKEEKDGKYMIIAGERRFRASQLAGKETITAYVRKADDENVVEMALVENIQREDLNPIEVALAYQKLIEQYGLTQEKLSERIGKNRATIANSLRLLRLPAEVQLGLKNKTIDKGHAKALLSLDDAKAQISIYEEIVENGYSVRNVEELVKSVLSGDTKLEEKPEKSEKMKKLPEEYNILKSHLAKYFNTKIQFTCNDKGKGKISIPFKSEEELERIISIFDRLAE